MSRKNGIPRTERTEARRRARSSLAARAWSGIAIAGIGLSGAQSYKYDFGPTGSKAPAGYTVVTPSTLYSSASGFGFEKDSVAVTCLDKGGNALTGDFCTQSGEFMFSVKLPQGNYNLTLYLGDPSGGSETTVKAENRRLLFDRVTLGSGQLATKTITVNRREAKSSDGTVTMTLKDRELGYYTWDEKLTLRFSGRMPAVAGLELAKADNAITWFLCGNSTVVDQLDSANEGWTAWGQDIGRFFKPGVAIANYAESGLTAGAFLAMKRLTKLLADSKPGDYVAVEFGHNDQKTQADVDAYPGNLKSFADQIKAKQCIPIFVIPTAREGDADPKTTIAGLAEVMRNQAKTLGVATIDLNRMTIQVMTAYGANAGKCYLDGTHFTEIGGYELARCVAKGIKDLNNALTPFLLGDRPVMDPALPDPIDYLTQRLQEEPTAIHPHPRSRPGKAVARRPAVPAVPTVLFPGQRGTLHAADGKQADIPPRPF
jgi:lysophospholipase L1-like esterase